jgi:hypothetical protein
MKGMIASAASGSASPVAVRIWTNERHQEGFDGVEFGRGDGIVMREIVDDVP